MRDGPLVLLARLEHAANRTRSDDLVPPGLHPGLAARLDPVPFGEWNGQSGPGVVVVLKPRVPDESVPGGLQPRYEASDDGTDELGWRIEREVESGRDVVAV